MRGTRKLREIPPPPTSSTEAHAAAERATAELQQQYRTWPEVAEVSARLAHVRERNHFSEALASLYGSKKHRE